MSQFPGKLGGLSRCEHTIIVVIVCSVADVVVCFTNTNAVSATASFKLTKQSNETEDVNNT